MLGDRKIVAFCTARIHDTLNFDLLKTLNRQLTEKGVSIFVYNICSDNYWSSIVSPESNVFKRIDYETIDSMVILDEQIKSRQITDTLVENARKHGIPVLIINGTHKHSPSICFDYKYGFELITRHVIEFHRARDVIFMGGIPGNPFSDDREETFKKVLKENGIPFKKEMVTYGYFYAEATQDAVERIILSGHIPEAIICANDIMAINTEQIIQKFDPDLADKIIITGYDGLDEIYFSFPQITSIKCNNVSIALEAAKLIELQLNGKPIPRETLIKPDLVIAGSCGCKTETIPIPDYFTKMSHRFFNFPEDTKAVFRIIERMQTAETIEEASNALARSSIYALSVVLSRSYIESDNAAVTDGDEDLIAFYDTDSESPFEPYPISAKQMIPNLEMHLNNGYPLIFNELDYGGISFGYVCFHFGTYNILNYARIPMLVTALRTSIGGYANLQYQKRIVKQLDETYKLDALTGLYNRLGFNKMYRPLQEKIRETGGTITVLISDLDRLKSINDMYGHSAGDNAVHQVAKALKNSCPTSALCVRFGGDEMLAVIEGDVDAEEIKKKIDGYLNEYNGKSNLPYTISTSIGIFKTDGKKDTDFETLIKGADKSLYREKKKHHAELKM